jgi:hypothetical protein
MLGIHRCLAAFEEVVHAHKGSAVVTIIEPMQAEGGDNHASPDYFRKLRDICKKVYSEYCYFFIIHLVVVFAVAVIINDVMIISACY